MIARLYIRVGQRMYPLDLENVRYGDYHEDFRIGVSASGEVLSSPYSMFHLVTPLLVTTAVYHPLMPLPCTP